MFRFTDNVIGQMTLQCNMNCKYCYEGRKVKSLKEYLSVPEFKNALDTALYQRCVLGDKDNTLNWHFHGGEPLLYDWEDLKECIRYINRRKKLFPNLSFCMQSNGVNLTEEKAEFFVKENMSLGISFDGFTDNDRMSELENRNLIEHLREIKRKTGIHFHCLSTLSKVNAKSWFNDMMSLRDLFDSCGINVLVPSEENDDLVLSAEEQWEYWLEPCLKSFTTSSILNERYTKIAIERVFSDIILNTKPDVIQKTGCFHRVCGHGINMISVNPKSKVYNCDKYLEEGDYIKDRFESSLDSYDFLGLQQIKRYGEYCKEIFNLENKYGCNHCYASDICLGGCQSYNLSRYNEYRLDTSMCKVYKKIVNFIRLNWFEILKQTPIQATKTIIGVNPDILRDLDNSNYYIKVDSMSNTISLEKKV